MAEFQGDPDRPKVPPGLRAVEGMPEGVRAFVGAADAEELLVRFTEGDGGPVLDGLSVRG